MIQSVVPPAHRPAPRILLLEDEVLLRKALRAFLKAKGMIVFEASSVSEALSLSDQEDVDLCILDYELSDGTAFDFLTKRSPQAPAIILSGRGTIGLAVEAVKLGAEHFLTKPVDHESLQKLVEIILERRNRERHLSASRLKSDTDEFDPFVGTSRAIHEVRKLAEAVVASVAPVLILGETGTGKSVLARWLHTHGPRSSEPFVDLNCAGLSKELAEADLFGHQKGASTGANSEKKGLLEVAHGGDVFLDEIGDLDLGVQPKLLKVLEEKTFRRVGDVKNRPADVRIIAATHRNLLRMSQEGAFRHDLLFRINTVTFHLPALRERKEDLVPLAEQILNSLCRRQGRRAPSLGPRACEILTEHDWPGNMRELRNSLERGLLFCRGDTIDNLNVAPSDGSVASQPRNGIKITSLETAEKNLIREALRVYEWRVDQAAVALEIPRSSLYAKIKKYGFKK